MVAPNEFSRWIDECVVEIFVGDLAATVVDISGWSVSVAQFQECLPVRIMANCFEPIMFF